MSTSGGSAAAPVAGQVLAQLSYTVASDSTYSTTSTSLTAIDATNLALTFTAPSSGNVLVETEGVYSSAAGIGGYVGVLSASSPIGNSGLVLQTSTTIRVRYSFLVTGLTAGSSYTFQLAWFTQNTADALTLKYGQSSSAPYGPINFAIMAA